MVPFKVSSVGAIVVLVFMLAALVAVLQVHRAPAQPAQVDVPLKTIANIVVHAHHHPSHAVA